MTSTIKNLVTSRYMHAALRLIVLSVFAIILYRIIDVTLLTQALQRVRFARIVAAVLLYFVSIAIRAYRWGLILNKDGKRLSLKDAYVVSLIGIALNMFVPATIGDIAKSYYGYKIYGIKEEMLSASLVDKMFAFCALFLMGAVSGAIMGHYLLCLVSLCAALFAAVFLFLPRYFPWNWLNRVLQVFRKSLDVEKLFAAFTLSSRLKGIIFGISVGGWVFTSFYFYILCTAFSLQVNFIYLLLMRPVLEVARLFPFTVNALGPREVVVAYFFHRIGLSPTLAVLVSLGSNIISSVIPGSIGLGIILISGHRTKMSAINTKEC